MTLLRFISGIIPSSVRAMAIFSFLVWLLLYGIGIPTTMAYAERYNLSTPWLIKFSKTLDKDLKPTLSKMSKQIQGGIITLLEI